MLGLWGSIMVGSLAHLYRKQIPTQLKIIRESTVGWGAAGGKWGVGSPNATRAPSRPLRRDTTRSRRHPPHHRHHPTPPHPSPAEARIIAQAGLISGAAGLAMVSALTHEEQSKGPASSSWKMRTFEPVGTHHGAAQGAAGHKDVAPVAAAAELK